MKSRKDVSALESLPLRLMIVAVVASLSIIPAGDALNALGNRDFINRAELQLESITSAAQLLAIAGPGGARTLGLDFRSDGSLAFAHITIGDGAGANRSSAVLALTNGATMVRTCTDPQPWLRSAQGLGLRIEIPAFELRLSACLEGCTAFILVEVT